MNSHYDWLEEHMPKVFEALGLNWEANCGIIVSHGDKCYGYSGKFEDAGLHFNHGVAIYLLSHVAPFSQEVRNTSSGWVPVDRWIIDNKDRFLPHLPAVEE